MAITKKTSRENVGFWESTKDAREKIKNWPTWKRNLKVTQFSVGFDSKSPGGLSPDGKRRCTQDS